MARLAKEDLRFTVTSDFASLKTVYVELYKRARQYCKARDRAEQLGHTETARQFEQIARRLFMHAHQINPWPTRYRETEFLPLPPEDWEEIHKGDI